MIPMIGLIIAAYTITRFISIAHSPAENWFTRLFAVFACLVTILTLVSLMKAGGM